MRWLYLLLPAGFLLGWVSSECLHVVFPEVLVSETPEIHSSEDRSEWLQLRTRDITSTQVAALFGHSPYMTPFELYHQLKKREVVQIEETERMEWGLALEDAIAAKLAQKQGWKIRKSKEYMRLPMSHIGASFDFFVIEPFDAILEIKNVDPLQFRNEWTENDDGSIEAPLHIEFQCQTQLMVSGKSTLYLGALIGGNKPVLLKREPDLVVQDAIRTQAAEMWRRVAHEDPPQLNFAKDMALVSRLYGYAEPGKVIESDTEIDWLAQAYTDFSQQMKQLEEQRNEMKAKILMKIGEAEKVLGPGYSITAGVTGPTWVEAFERKGFRQFRVNRKKVKDE